ncbi:Gfo/Idh/MocA family protein [Streptomyces sp. NBC_00328]|uniref:Gfo/Idh/MocA family protein n=1 Tax=Streptomyces sp. NBC_00328 TaxID=2903646 RepID=UPI002E2B890B|nr:Gfo/Idh/MocA family oxidoreductase [Streptomyces sp. NBC_00328]
MLADSAAVRPLTVGVLGTSSFAGRRMVPALHGCPDTRLAAVAGRDAARARRTAAQWGCSSHAGYEEILSRPDIDAVYVPLPNSLHHTWVRRALHSGKHVLAEKPLTTEVHTTTELFALAAERGLVLRENYAFEHHDRHRAARALVEQGGIGQIRHFSSSFCIPSLPADNIRHRPDLGGGALLDAGVYPVRAAQYFLGDELTVAGAVLRWDPDYGVDIGGSALLRCADGVTAALTFGFGNRYGAEYELWGSAGRLDTQHAFAVGADDVPLLRVEDEDGVRRTALDPQDQYLAVVAAFAAAVRGAQASGADPGHEVTAARARRTAELVARIADLARTVTEEPTREPAGAGRAGDRWRS